MDAETSHIGPWRISPQRCFTSRSFWLVIRIIDARPQLIERLMSHRQPRRFYSEAKAQAMADQLNAAKGGA